jgi:hypothetical protein
VDQETRKVQNVQRTAPEPHLITFQNICVF